MTFAAFPKDPEIHLSGPLEVGQLVTATCLVPDVYPFDRLEIALLKDNRLLKNQEFLEPMDRKSLETKSLEVTFTPTSGDIGKALVCRATLHIDVDEELRERATTKELQVYSKCGATVWALRALSLGCVWQSTWQLKSRRNAYYPILFTEDIIFVNSVFQ